MCGAIFGGALSIDCSYSAAATEQVNIPAAVAGQWYMLLVTNFSNAPTNISAAAGNVAGVVDGTTNCAILCNMTSLTANPGACVPATNQYQVTGTILTTNPPTTGTLTITSSCGGTPIVLTPPFATSRAPTRRPLAEGRQARCNHATSRITDASSQPDSWRGRAP